MGVAPPVRGGPYVWDALTYLCFSRHLRLRGSDRFVRAAEVLLAGRIPNTGFFEPAHQPEPTSRARFTALQVLPTMPARRACRSRVEPTRISAERSPTTRRRVSTTRR
jgi:hypothetical protein